MFTGIIKDIGTVKSFELKDKSAVLTVRLEGAFSGSTDGDSVAVDGTCLTIVSHDEDSAVFELGPETLAKTKMKGMQEGQELNIEFPLRLVDAMGGHFVQGHVDGIAQVTSVSKDGETTTLELELPKELHNQTILHGSIAVDGVSLTVAQRNDENIKIMLMPYTMQKTNFDSLKVGDPVNIEVDMLAKYVAQQLSSFKKEYEGK